MSLVILEPWQFAFRHFARLIERPGIVALRDALATLDPRLTQKATTRPGSDQDNCASACPLAFALWQGRHLDNRPAIEQAFYALLESVEPRHASAMLKFWDESPREKAWAGLLAECEAVLQEGDKCQPSD